MASNAEMRRLILHAADQLAGTPGANHIADAVHEHVNVAIRRQAARDLASFTATIALAEQTLRMVAACLADDEPEVPANASVTCPACADSPALQNCSAHLDSHAGASS